MADNPPKGTGLNLVGGAWIAPVDGQVRHRRNPARPNEQLAASADSSAADIDLAVAAAANAYPGWKSQSGVSRATILFRAAELTEQRSADIAATMTRETGKPIREALPEVMRCVGIFRYYASEAWRRSGEVFDHAVSGAPIYVQRRPRGVFGLITPWNFPAAIPAWKIAPALVFGNSVVIKLSEESPETGLEIVRCLADAGLPSGVLNAVVGRGPEVGSALVEHPQVCGISFTGSVAVGRQVREAATRLGKPTQLELGGQNPLVVMSDADLDRAVEQAFAGAFFSAGQKCTATRRIFIEDAVYDDFRRRLLERTARGVVGDPADPRTEVGPVVNERQWNMVWDGIERGQAEGGNRIVGGDRGSADDGYYVTPTIFEGVDDDKFLSCEEVFGPVTSLYSFGDLDEAISRANAVEYGLSAAIFTSNLNHARAFSRDIQAGVIHINSQTPGAEIHVPFGGVKASGWGSHEQGRAAMEFYTELVTVYEDV
jgi:aldehyde dehydrogenase (NAD+)